MVWFSVPDDGSMPGCAVLKLSDGRKRNAATLKFFVQHVDAQFSEISFTQIQLFSKPQTVDHDILTDGSIIVAQTSHNVSF